MPEGASDGDESRRARVLVVHDDEDFRLLLRLTLQRDARIEVVTRPEDEPDLVIVDQILRSGRWGDDVAQDVKATCAECKVLLLVSQERVGPRLWSPAVDSTLRKDQIRDLLVVVQQLVGLSTDAETG